ncbi:unnamed protein product, partial [Discosporangium mesarthrocarpum]
MASLAEEGAVVEGETSERTRAYFCHSCQAQVGATRSESEELKCDECGESFVEEVVEGEDRDDLVAFTGGQGMGRRGRRSPGDPGTEEDGQQAGAGVSLPDVETRLEQLLQHILGGVATMA